MALTWKENKYHIAPESIRANIYDQVELLVDFHGITKKDIELAQEAMKEVLDPKEYSMSEEFFSLDELQYYAEHHNISLAMQKRLRDTESVIRFYTKDRTECITISRLYNVDILIKSYLIPPKYITHLNIMVWW